MFDLPPTQQPSQGIPYETCHVMMAQHERNGFRTIWNGAYGNTCHRRSHGPKEIKHTSSVHGVFLGGWL